MQLAYACFGRSPDRAISADRQVSRRGEDERRQSALRPAVGGFGGVRRRQETRAERRGAERRGAGIAEEKSSLRSLRLRASA